MRFLLAVLITAVIVLFVLAIWYGRSKKLETTNQPRPPRPPRRLGEALEEAQVELRNAQAELGVELRNAQAELRDVHATLAADMEAAMSRARGQFVTATVTTRTASRPQPTAPTSQPTPAPQTTKLHCGCDAPPPPKVKSRFDLMDEDE